MPRSRERTLYLQLLNDLERAQRDVLTIQVRIHDLLDAIDNKEAKRIANQVKKELEL